jgi:hypothetical protein
MIYETDTDMVALWNGSAWRYIASTTATSGSVLQVASTTVTGQTSTTSTSFVDISGLSVSITPKSTSSKVFVAVSLMASAAADDTWYNLVRGSTNIAQGVNGSSNASAYARLTDGLFPEIVTINFLDSPSTTSSTTYKVQWRTRVGTVYLNQRAYDAGSPAPTGVSSITVMEIAG